jgi:hypothetical protein
MNKFLIVILTMFIHSCSSNLMSGLNNSKFASDSSENSEDYSVPTNQLNKTRELLDGASINFPTLTATGYAVVSTQPGQNVEQKKTHGNKGSKNGCNERISRANSRFKS